MGGMEKDQPKRILYLPITEARRALNDVVGGMNLDYDYVILTVRGNPRAALIPPDEFWSDLDIASAEIREAYSLDDVGSLNRKAA